MTEVTINHDLEKIPVFLNDLSHKVILKAVKRSLSRSITAVATKASREIRKQKQIKMKARDLKKRFLIRKSLSGNISSLCAELSFSTRSEGLHRYFPKKVKVSRSVNGKPLHGMRVKALGKSYIAGRGFMYRKVILKRTGKGRYPLEKMWGPSVSGIVEYRQLQGMLVDVARERYEREFVRSWKWYGR